MKVELTKKSVPCPEPNCEGLCYWSVHDDPQELRCVICGHIVKKRKKT